MSKNNRYVTAILFVASILYAALLFVLFCTTFADAKTHRSSSARHHFMVETGFPHGRPGYVVDHWLALACGGPDEPSNMQWSTAAEGKAKDRIERTPEGCEFYRTHRCPDCGE